MNQYDSIDREAIWAGLFAYLQRQIGGLFVTMGRRLIAPPDLTLVQQPALFLVQMQETHKPQPRGVPTRLVLQGFLIVYALAPVINEDPGSETVLAATTLNTIFKDLDEALKPDTSEGYFSLGGQVSHCWREGDTSMDPGLFGPQTGAVIPIKILVP